MPSKAPRPCPRCKHLITTRYCTNPVCPAARARAHRSHRSWTELAAATVEAHRLEHGDWCPGYGRPGHASTDLTADHDIALVNGGTDDPDNLTVLCRSCNTTKGAA